jgi:hypothetical protein
LLQGLGIFGQFIGDALKRRIVITRPDRLLRIARHRFDRRSLLLLARWPERGDRRLRRSDPQRLRPRHWNQYFRKQGTKKKEPNERSSRQFNGSEASSRLNICGVSDFLRADGSPHTRKSIDAQSQAVFDPPPVEQRV